MAAASQTVQKLIRNLKDNSKALLQCGALTYIRSNAEKLETTSVLKEEEYSEICRLVIDAITSGDQSICNEATKALHAVLKHFKSHNLKFFESALQVNRKKRHKIFQFLANADDDVVFTAAQDPSTVNFMNDCMHTVQTNTMEWLLPSACTDHIQKLTQAECRLLSEDQDFEERTINYALALLLRLYKIASLNADFQSTQRFDTLLMDKVVTLAYMGHKRQRAPAIKLLDEAIGGNLAKHIKTKYSDVWARYKTDLQNSYCTRMSLLVKSCELDWASQWSITIRLLGTDLHRGAVLINSLLSVEEKAFKSTDTNVRRQAFVAWKLLIDNFALDPKELGTSRRIKLLCTPLTAKNSKSELIALIKLEVWWYLIVKLYANITKFADPVVTQFLNFCFGPLGDTPLLSTNVDVIASPGKRFYKTKVVAIDALLQLVVRDQNERKDFAPILTERLTQSITDELFKECYKPFLHSIGEAAVILGEMQESGMRDRENIIRVLLTNLMRYVQSTSAEMKASVYNEFILVVTELQNRALEMSCVNDFILDIFVPELAINAADLTYRDRILMDLISKIMTPTILKSIQKKHCDHIKCLLWQMLKPKGQTQFHSETLQFLGKTIQEIESIPTDETGFVNCFELWFALAEIAYKYAMTHDVNEGTETEPSFKTIEAIIRFPFVHMYSSNSMQAEKIAVNWKDLYKQFECKADAIAVVKPNEIFESTSKMIKDCLVKNEKCYRLAVYCLDALLSTINYENLLGQNKIPTIVRLVADLTAIALREGQPQESDCALRALSSLLITVYGHSPEKALVCLKETSQTIELMLKTDTEDILIKEITSTWETIVSILRGLNTLLDANFLSSYKDIILSATRHTNSEIVFQADTVLALKDNLKEAAKAILADVEQEVKKSLLKIKSDKADRAMKQVRMAGSFMNRKIPSPRPSLGKQKEREEKKLAPLPPEPDSQDYVVIKTDLKLDVSRLTEHQKESFKRRRDDIPAMYNDLSQSSSQDTQDLQQWFDGKGKQTELPTTVPIEKDASAPVPDDDHDKENKIDKIGTAREEKTIEEPIAATNTAVSKSSEEKSSTQNATPASLGPSGQEPGSDFAATAESPKEPEKPPQREKKELQQVQVNLSPIISPLADHSYVGTPMSQEAPCNDDEIIAKKLDFESRDEYPEDREKEADESFSSSDATSSSAKANRALRSNKTATEANNVKKLQTKNLAKPLRAGRELKSLIVEMRDQSGASIQTRRLGKSKVTTRRSQSNAAERGVKRKAASDSESEGSEKSKRFRGKASRSPSETPSDAESPTPIHKRTENEMARLIIDMKDGPPRSRRRSKVNEEFVSSENLGKRLHSPDAKLTRAKSAEKMQSDSNLRRSLRGSEREGGGSADATKKRRKSRNNAGGKGVIGSRKLADSEVVGTNSVSQMIVDDEETQENSVDSKVEESPESTNPNVPSIIVTTPSAERNVSHNSAVSNVEESAMNDDDDVVESSQDDLSAIGTNRKSIISSLNFGRNSSVDEIKARTENPEPVINEIIPRASSPIIPMEEPLDTVVLSKDTSADDKTLPHDDSDETFLDISAIRSQPTEDIPPEDAEKKASEETKTNGSSSTSKAEPAFNFSSPKNPSKRFTKPKGFAVHGRAAHMLGLVTKLAVMEKDGEIERTDDDSASGKKNRTKENESEQLAVKKDRQTIFKDSERIGSPGGSRQEKIFNNMKSADYAASPPAKMFCNLKNNGEKLSPNMGKIHGTSLDSDASGAREDDEDVSQPSERDELPMLEWSSANPPSLTASPSASILKRIRQIAADTENDNTPNKSLRKRVSFADPPVSKEMGYEIAPGGSPLKTSKFTARSLFDRKNSPLRLKQSRFKMIQIEAEKSDKDEEPRALSSSEVDSDCERENAILAKIAEDLEDTAEFRTGEMSLEANAPTILQMNNSREEIVIGAKLQATPEKINDVETQEDIFNSSDEKNESPKRFASLPVDITKNDFCNSTQNSTIDSLKLNVTDDSVIASIEKLASDEHEKSECLEDTVDVKNLTGLNSTANSDEMFCEKPMRSSTQAPEGMSQMDTLPISDSIFASLPMTQDSQDSTQANMELAQPQLLNSTDAIYPSLVDCQKPVECIVDSLTNPLWIKNLSKQLATRGISTVGDLARLSEREVDRIPVKGCPKVDFVRKVLSKFEEQLPAVSQKRPGEKNNSKTADYLALVSDKDDSLNIGETMDVDELPTFDVSAVTLPSQYAQNDLVCDSVCVVDFDRQSIRRTSTTMSSVATDPSVCTVHEETATVSQMSTINLSSDTLPGMMVSIATSTESLPKPPSKTVGTQIHLEDLLDEVDAKLVLQSAVRRCSAETLLTQYKLKMGHMPETELGKETMRMLGLDSKTPTSEATLKAACRACGLIKVLDRLPEIFSTDKQFYAKVLTTYRQKISSVDCVESQNFQDIKNAICNKCSASELAEMLLKAIKREEKQCAKSELACLKGLLKKIPLDAVIRNTVANKDLIPSSLVLDIALKNNDADLIANEIESKYSELAEKIVDRKIPSMSKDRLLSIHKAICAQLSAEDLLDANHEAMKRKLNDHLG